MSFSYSKEEMTVTLNYDQFNKKWEAYTNIPKYRDKMIRAGWTLDKEGKVDGKVVDWFFSIDFENALSFRDVEKARRPKILTDEERATLARRLSENMAKKRREKEDDVSGDI